MFLVGCGNTPTVINQYFTTSISSTAATGSGGSAGNSSSSTSDGGGGIGGHRIDTASSTSVGGNTSSVSVTTTSGNGGSGGMDTCSDGTKNSDELDVDCGFVACKNGCPVGSPCVTDADCNDFYIFPAGNFCVNQKCTRCFNYKQDPNESGKDCGGPCLKCTGDPCLSSDECRPGDACINGKCGG